MRRFLLILAALCTGLLPATAQAERVRDLGQFQGVRSNQLTGYGIVVGLPGTGDDNLEYVTQAMKGVSGRMGLQLPPGVQPALKNAAAVIVTADLPAFAKPGQRIDVTVSTMGKAKSLRGGALIMTPLYGADGQIYAMAQGNLAVGGLGVSAADGSKLTVNVPTVGRIADGGSVERAVATGFDSGEVLRYNLFNADFLTASRVRDAINRMLPGTASIEDGVTLALRLPAGSDRRASLMAAIEMLEISPAETPARRDRRDQQRRPPVARRDQPRYADGADRREPDDRPARPVQRRPHRAGAQFRDLCRRDRRTGRPVRTRRLPVRDR